MKAWIATSLAFVCATINAGEPSNGSVGHKHWYKSVSASELSDMHVLPAFPNIIPNGFLGGSQFDGDTAIMMEFHVLSPRVASLIMFIKKPNEVVLVIAPRINYKIEMPPNCPVVCTFSGFLVLDDNLPTPGRRVVLFPPNGDIVESSLFHEIGGFEMDTVLMTSPNHSSIGLVASEDLVVGPVILRRLSGDTPPVDWNSFLHKELQPLGVDKLPETVITMLTQTAAVTKDGSMIYTGFRKLLLVVSTAVFAVL